jgi:hypothetical protein
MLSGPRAVVWRVQARHTRVALPFPRTVNAPVVPLPAPRIELPPKAIIRSHPRLSYAEHEQVLGRAHAGIHFLEGCTAGLRMGNQMADWVYSGCLRP